MFPEVRIFDEISGISEKSGDLVSLKLRSAIEFTSYVVRFKDLRPSAPSDFRYGRTVFLVEETGVSGENHRRSASNCQFFSHAAPGIEPMQ